MPEPRFRILKTEQAAVREGNAFQAGFGPSRAAQVVVIELNVRQAQVLPSGADEVDLLEKTVLKRHGPELPFTQVNLPDDSAPDDGLVFQQVSKSRSRSESAAFGSFGAAGGLMRSLTIHHHFAPPGVPHAELPGLGAAQVEVDDAFPVQVHDGARHDGVAVNGVPQLRVKVRR